MKSRILICMMAIFLAMSGSAMAATIDVLGDVKQISQSQCTQSGFYTLKMPDNTQIKVGDIINLTLTETVTLCKSLDFFLAIADEGSNLAMQDTSLPVYATQAQNYLAIKPASGENFVETSNYVFGFHIQGSSGARTVSMTAKMLNTTDDKLYTSTNGSSILTHYMHFNATNPDNGNPTAGDITDQMTIELFNEKNRVYNPKTGHNPGFLDDDSTATRYTQMIAAEDNVMCIDTSVAVLEAGNYVTLNPQSSPSSGGFSHTFTTGNNRVAQVSGASTWTIAALGKADCQEFTINAGVDQEGNAKLPDVELDAGDYVHTSTSACGDAPWQISLGNPWCASSSYYGRGAIITNTATDLTSNDLYRIKMTLVTKAAGASSYTNATNAGFQSAGGGSTVYYSDSADSGNLTCAGSNIATKTFSSAWTAGNVDSTSESFVLTQNEDTIAVYRDAYTSTWTGIPAGETGYDSLVIDIGTVDYNPAALAIGTELAVLVELEKKPCGTLASAYICLGIVTDDVCSTTGQCAIAFPYGINYDNPLFWSGIAITNQSASSNEVTLTFTDATGGMATYSETLAGNEIKVINVDSSWFAALPASSTLVAGQAWRVDLLSKGKADAILMIGGLTATVIDGGIYGYKGRNTCYASQP